MNDITISVGTTLSIVAAVPGSQTAAAFEALAWIEVGEVENIPAFGGTATVTEFIPIKTGVVNKKKGSINYGTMTIPLAMMLADAGQIALQSGFDGANKSVVHSLKISNPNIGNFYTTVEITSLPYNFGDANAVTRNEVGFAVKTKPIVDADVFTVTYAAGANGSIIGNTSQTVLSGEDCTPVYAAPDAGYVFVDWDEDSGTDNPRTDTAIAADATFTATFAAA
jgi:hypothetical protein